MQTHSIIQASLGVITLGVGCAVAGTTYAPGQRVTCDDGPRTLVDCDTYATLEHQVVEANAGLKELGFGLGGRYESAALKQVRESTEHLALSLESACRDYNACVTTAAGYLEFKTEAATRLSKHLNLVAAQGGGASATLGDEIWSNAVPEAAAKRLTLSYTVASRQGGAFVPHASGDALSSGTELRIDVRPNQEAYIYVILVTAHDSPVALFPNPDFGGKNPIPAGQRVTLPPSNVALLLDRRPGTEHLEFIASLTPLERLEASLTTLRVTTLDSASASPTTAAQSTAAQITAAQNTAAQNTAARTNLLTDVGKLLCASRVSRELRFAGTRVDCDNAPTRGLVLVKRSDDLEQQVVAVPNDDVVILQHAIEHR